MKLLKIPYIQQINPNACGAAVLEMIYKYYGVKDVSQMELMRRYQELEPHGSGNFRMTTDALVADAKERGFESKWLRANYQNMQDCHALLKSLVEEEEIPVIVCQQYTNKFPLIGHFRIVLGVDNNFIYLHDPSVEIGGKNLQWSVSRFVNFWQPTGENVTGGIYCLINSKK